MVRIKKFRTTEEAEKYLSGAIIGGPIGNIKGLSGKTLSFTSPNTTDVLFTAGANSDYLTFNEIKDQVETEDSDLVVTSVGGSICIVEAVPTSGVTLKATASYAKSLLGFAYDVATVGVIPPVITMYFDSQNCNHVVVVQE